MSDKTQWTPESGDAVLLVRADRGNRSIRKATVLRVGKRDIVLDNGERFNARRLEKQQGGTWGWTVKLMRPDDPFAVGLAEEIRHSNAVDRARGICEDFRYGREGVTAFDVLVAVAPLTGLAEQVAALVDEGDRS